jgi:ABC-type glycerol-3-phosphate transport system substrate-binding protein
MEWATAWTDLITIASHGKGPDISHIGGSWVSSLAIMNALRPFRPNEVAVIGGAEAFIRPVWESVRLIDDDRIWSIPWTGYVYFIAYRKDMLAYAGIDDPQAFSTLAKLIKTVEKLRSSRLEIPVVVPYIPAPFTDLIHMAAAFVWSAGGDFVNRAGEKVVFNSPEALAGLKTWLDFARLVPRAYSQLDQAACMDLFARGRAAAIVADNRYMETNLVLGQVDDLVRNNLVISNLTEVPRCEGGNFVIWQHTQGYPDRERAAVEFVQFLSRRESQLTWNGKVHSMPSRQDVLDEVYPPGHPLHTPFLQAATQGRDNRSIPLWRRLEFQISQALGTVLQEAQENPGTSSLSLLEKHMLPLAERLNLTLKV